MFSAPTLIKAGLTLGAVYAAAYANALYQHSDLRHFKASDFGVWLPLLNSDLIDKVDQFADYMQARVIISPAVGAIGRAYADAKNSQHYPDPTVDAIDLMLPDSTLADAYDGARAVGFHGIGLYPEWKPHKGIHVDLREGRNSDNPALWSAYKDTAGVQQYTGIQVALA